MLKPPPDPPACPPRPRHHRRHRRHRRRRHPATATAAATLSFADHLSVVLDAGGARAEHEPVLPIAERVEDDEKAVGVGQRRVAAAFGADDELGRAVVIDDADIERCLGVEHAHFGVFRRRLPFIRRRLPEPGDHFGRSPRLVVEHVAVDDGHRLRRAASADTDPGGGASGGAARTETVDKTRAQHTQIKLRIMGNG